MVKVSVYTEEFQNSLSKVLEIAPQLKPIVDNHTFPSFYKDANRDLTSFQYLVRIVISQQLSGTASNKIRDKFLNFFGCQDSFPAPKQICSTSVDQLRELGFSRRKAEYVIGLSELYNQSELSDELFEDKSDKEVTDIIVSVRGLGPWTAQMFLIFYLKRMDVFSPGDLGVQRGIRRYLESFSKAVSKTESKAEESGNDSSGGNPITNRNSGKRSGTKYSASSKQKVKPDLKLIEEVSAKFAPHRTAFQLILWKLSDIEMETVEARDADMKKEYAQQPHDIVNNTASDDDESGSSSPPPKTKKVKKQ